MSTLTSVSAAVPPVLLSPHPLQRWLNSFVVNAKSGVAAAPPHLVLHGGPGRSCPRASNGLCPVSPRGCHHRCLPHRMVGSVAKQALPSIPEREVCSLTVDSVHQDRNQLTRLLQVSHDHQSASMYIPGEQNQLPDLFSCQKPSMV